MARRAVMPMVFLAATLAVMCVPRAAADVRGSREEDAARYPASPEVERTIAATMVNDDYCDCPDGSDEPGTAACSGRFYCRNNGHRGRFIFSSRVNDGVCDCCDGSDEYGTGKCADVCSEKATEFRRQYAERLVAIEAGLKVREQWVKEAAEALVEKRSRLESLRATAAAAGELVDKAERLVELETELEARQKVEAEAEATLQAARELGLRGLTAAQLQQLLVAVVLEHQDAVLPTLMDKLRAIAPEAAAAVEAGAEAGAGGAEAGGSAGDDVAAATTVEVTAEGEVADAVEDEGEVELELELEDGGAGLSTAAAGPAAALQRLRDRSFSRPEAEAARKALEDARGQKERAEKDAAELERVVELDFGPDDAYYALYDQCISSTVGQYKYEICPYERARQDYTTLGFVRVSWLGWTNDKYTEFKFSGGTRCWNGPERSMTVKLRCGDETKLHSVDEPSTCVYVAEVSTPAACSQGEAEALLAELDE